MTTMIRVLTYNTHFGRHLKKIIPWLNTESPSDILCFQEFPKHKLDELRAGLTGAFGCRFSPSLGSTKRRVFGVATLYRKKSIQCIKSFTVPLGVNILEKAWFRSNVERTCQVCMFRGKKRTFMVANTHLVCSAPNSHRYRQVEKIISVLLQYKKPSVICGDFNVLHILGKKKLIRLMKKHSFSTDLRKMATFRFAGLRFQVDYVFWNGMNDMSLDVIKVRFSDHFPIRFVLKDADMKIRRRKDA